MAILQGTCILIPGKITWPHDLETYFGMVKGDVFYFEDCSFPQILKKHGFFATTKQARDAGFLEIPPGWSEYTIGKKRRRLFIWNPQETFSEWYVRTGEMGNEQA